MLFKCNTCNFEFPLPIAVVMACEDHLHCVNCGAGMDKLDYIANQDNNSDKKTWLATKDNHGHLAYNVMIKGKELDTYCLVWAKNAEEAKEKLIVLQGNKDGIRPTLSKTA